MDFERLKDFAHAGVSPRLHLHGLGLNAAHREDFLDNELSKIPSSTGERRFLIVVQP